MTIPEASWPTPTNWTWTERGQLSAADRRSPIWSGSPGRFPSRPAIIHGNSRTSYRDFWRRSLQFASALARRGIGKGDTVTVIAFPTTRCPMLRRISACRWSRRCCIGLNNAPRCAVHRLPARPCRDPGADRRPRVLRRGEGGAGARRGEAAGHRLRRSEYGHDAPIPRARPSARGLRGVPRFRRCGFRLVDARRRVGRHLAQQYVRHHRQSQGRRPIITGAPR